MIKIIPLCFLFILLSCQKTDKKNTAISEQEILETLDILAAPEVFPHSHLFITFSSTKQSLFDYSLFKLGLIDIIFEIEHENEILRHSISSKIWPSDIYLDDAEGVNLTPLTRDEQLYHGFVKVPTGKLLKIEIAFSGARSEIVIDETPLTLTNSFFSLFAHEDEKNPDKLDVQRLAISTELTLNESILLKDGELKAISIDIDKDASFHIEPFNSVDNDRVYAEFKPTFQVKELAQKNDFLAPIKLRFYDFQNIDLSQDDGKLFIFGDPQEKLFISDMDSGQANTLWLDGEKVDSLEKVFGLYQVDMQGTLRIDESGYHYQLDKAYLLKESNDKSKGSAYGKITKKKTGSIILSGGKLPLKADNYSHLGARFLTQMFEGDFTPFNEGDWVQVTYKNDQINTIVKINMPPLKKITTFLAYKTSLRIPEKNLLNITSPVEDNLTFSMPMPCSEIILSATKSGVDICSSSPNIKQLNLSNDIDDVTLLISRRGSFATITESDELVFIQEPNQIFHFKNRDALKDKIDELIKSKHRVLSINANGKLSKATFTANNFLTISFLSPQKDWDIISDDLRKEETILKGDVGGGGRLRQARKITTGLLGFIVGKIKGGITPKRPKYTQSIQTRKKRTKTFVNITNQTVIHANTQPERNVARKNKHNSTITQQKSSIPVDVISQLSTQKTNNGLSVSKNGTMARSFLSGYFQKDLPRPSEFDFSLNQPFAEPLDIAFRKRVKAYQDEIITNTNTNTDRASPVGELPPPLPPKRRNIIAKTAQGGTETSVPSINPSLKTITNQETTQATVIRNISTLAAAESVNNKLTSQSLSENNKTMTGNYGKVGQLTDPNLPPHIKAAMERCKQAIKQGLASSNTVDEVAGTKKLTVASIGLSLDNELKFLQSISNEGENAKARQVVTPNSPTSKYTDNMQKIRSDGGFINESGRFVKTNEFIVESTNTKKNPSTFNPDKVFSQTNNKISIDPSAPALPPKTPKINTQTTTTVRASRKG